MTSERDPKRVIRRLDLIGYGFAFFLVVVVGGWVTLSELSGAVIAPGLIVVESNVKKVQHPTGGVVAQISVKDGTHVEAGQLLLRLDDTLPRAQLGVVQSQLDAFLARQARLLAERDDAERLRFADELVDRAGDDAVTAAMSGEVRLFESRRTGRASQRSQLRERIAQTQEEIRGLEAQFESKDKEMKFLAEELEGAIKLYELNLVTVMRFMALQRDQARLEGDRGRLIAEMARARAKVSETELQLLQLDQDAQTEVLKDLRETEAKIAELRERRAAAIDQLKRVDIFAPQAGFVHQLALHTIGGVVGPGETVMLIVPFSDSLIVEAKVAPQDIDQVRMGGLATVRIMAGNQRVAPDLNGAITHVSADLTREQQGNQPAQSYFLVRVALGETEGRRLNDLKLVPGMPAEVFMQTQSRSPLRYLLKPVEEQIVRTFRER